MDFEFTNRSSVTPAWAQSSPNLDTPRKRSFNELNTPTKSLSSPLDIPRFGNNFGPYPFETPYRQTAQPYHWDCPPGLSHQKTPDGARDVDMTEASPPKPRTDPKAELNAEESEASSTREVSNGALQRLYRRRTRGKGRPVVTRTNNGVEVSDESDGQEDDLDREASVTHRTSNHYTLNLPSTPSSPSDRPYVLLGYLQFFFNLSLVLVFLYLLLQFILTVQRDVEHRISEYSMDIVQEIALCASHYKNNLCATSPIPAMIRQCGAWETCMNRDPTVVGRARVSAEMIAEVVNGFVEPISWKTLAFTLTSLSFLTVFVNALLSLYRSRHRGNDQAQHPYPVPSIPFAPSHINSHPSWHHLSDTGDEASEIASRRRRLEGGRAIKIQ
ncbi:hypothetical protein CONPUDRAFT_44919 [Coniophora puteana RWD-64-598 SS2]|uniref:Brl1/Brr6 domain-containing protein n=1 Tax=Coniophora puteana (strain RWD-64-598) TaxID=741705 RepID=A0A5M3N4H3_CONPW|nr:uncharacterized protein CONPUDRAFT_44919 [Coniophora puteana RWD-64-598 SS2]EIW86322.1 hypothetical protein CONPUDRAFT_44919 [Coniophora puteana RWD-64-598 SS2]